MKSILTKLLGIGRNLWAFVAPVIQSESGNLLEQLLPLALSTVKEVAVTHDLPNEKRDAALAQLKDRAAAAGLSAGTSLLNLAIELAVARSKSLSGN